MSLDVQKRKTLSQPAKQPMIEPPPQELLGKLIEQQRIEQLEKTQTGREYLQETAKANKSLLCYTFNVEDEKDNPTGAERTICRKSGSKSIVFAWDSLTGNLLKDKPIKKRE